jgi:hypothetical protein
VDISNLQSNETPEILSFDFHVVVAYEGWVGQIILLWMLKLTQVSYSGYLGE